MDYDRGWSSQEWKIELRLRRTIDQGHLIKTDWRMVRKVRSGHEEIPLDGTAQSVRYGRNPS